MRWTENGVPVIGRITVWQISGLALLAGNVHKIGNFLLATQFIEAAKSGQVHVETLVIGRLMEGLEMKLRSFLSS